MKINSSITSVSDSRPDLALSSSPPPLYSCLKSHHIPFLTFPSHTDICEDDEDCYSCPDDCSSVSGAHCGNAMCEAGDGENCQTCPEDCLSTSGICCGMNGQCDARCRAASRGCRTNMTVMACCGDQQCEGAETASSCPRDCASNEHARPDLVLQHATDSNGRMCEYSSTAGSSFEVIVHHQADSFDASLVARALAMLADQHDVTFASLFVQSEEVDSETTVRCVGFLVQFF